MGIWKITSAGPLVKCEWVFCTWGIGDGSYREALSTRTGLGTLRGAISDGWHILPRIWLFPTPKKARILFMLLMLHRLYSTGGERFLPVGSLDVAGGRYHMYAATWRCFRARRPVTAAVWLLRIAKVWGFECLSSPLLLITCRIPLSGGI